MTGKELEILCKNSTVGLHSLSPSIVPTGSASGCIIRYRGARILLTVEHAVGNGERWAVKCEITPAPDSRQKYFFPSFTHVVKGAMNLAAISSGESDPKKLIVDPKSLDYSLAQLDDGLNIFDYYPTETEGTLEVYKANELATDLELEPNKESTYAFYGQTKTKLNIPLKKVLNEEMRISGIKYWKTVGDFYYFNLPSTIKSEEEYQGCSGAPILDQEGRLVSLVASGYVGTNILLGVNLKMYQVLADIEIGKI